QLHRHRRRAPEHRLHLRQGSAGPRHRIFRQGFQANQRPDRSNPQAPHGLHRLPQSSHPHLRPARYFRRSLSSRAPPRYHPALHQTAGGRRPHRQVRDNDEAMQGIAKTIYEFYKSKYPDLTKTKEPEIRAAIDETQRIYKLTFFPEMKLDWRTHPNNIGHLYFNGCFRCHDGNHVSPEGKVIPKDCNSCHTVLSQSENKVAVETNPPGQFKHPVDLGDLTMVTCSDCHTGGVSP